MPYTQTTKPARYEAAVTALEECLLLKRYSWRTIKSYKKGVDLRYIQDLLGHESSKTTEIYTHITKKGWDKLRSPIDDLPI